MQKYKAAIYCSAVLILAFFNSNENSAAAKASFNPSRYSTSAQYNGNATEAKNGVRAYSVDFIF
jgi:hypothetical protein